MVKRSVLVTGAAGDVGSALSRRLAADGHRLLLADIDVAATELLAQGLPDAVVVPLDLADPASIRTAAHQVRDHGLHAIASCAGNVWFGPFAECSPHDWDQLYQVNLRGPMLLTQELLPTLRDCAAARIVYVSSDAARAGGAGETAYSAMKAGLFGLAKSLAREYASDGLCVNVVCPGVIDGQMVSTTMADHPETLTALTKSIPLKRLANPGEVAAMIAYLLSPDASYVTGQVLSVSGGMTMH